MAVALRVARHRVGAPVVPTGVRRDGATGVLTGVPTVVQAVPAGPSPPVLDRVDVRRTASARATVTMPGRADVPAAPVPPAADPPAGGPQLVAAPVAVAAPVGRAAGVPTPRRLAR
jgi:hypothetical protein